MVFKLTVFVKKHDDFTDEEFHEYWSKKHAQLFLGTANSKKCFLRYAQFHVNKKLSIDLASKAPGLEVPDYDGIGEFWANSVEDILEYLADEEYQRVVVPDEYKFTKRDEWKILVGEYEDKFLSDLVASQR